MSALSHQMARGIHSASAGLWLVSALALARGSCVPVSSLNRESCVSLVIEEQVKHHTAQLCSSCPVSPGDTSAAVPQAEVLKASLFLQLFSLQLEVGST